MIQSMLLHTSYPRFNIYQKEMALGYKCRKTHNTAHSVTRYGWLLLHSMLINAMRVTEIRISCVLHNVLNLSNLQFAVCWAYSIDEHIYFFFTVVIRILPILDNILLAFPKQNKGFCRRSKLCFRRTTLWNKKLDVLVLCSVG